MTDAENAPKFGQRLSRLIARTNMPKAAVAEKCGINRSTLSNLCSGARMPTIPQLIRLADTLAVSVDYLLGREEMSQLQQEIERRHRLEARIGEHARALFNLAMGEEPRNDRD